MTAPDPPSGPGKSAVRKIASITLIAFFFLCSLVVSTQLKTFLAQESFRTSLEHDGELLKTTPIDTESKKFRSDSRLVYMDSPSRVTQLADSNAIGVISNVAGYGSYDYSGDTGIATSAGLSSPDDVAVDSLGNVYIADSGNNCIRLVTKSTGIITTVAGTGTSGYSGDLGRATSAKLSYPRGLAVDASGNIYIADTYSNRIRLVTKGNGIITTVAGTGSAGFSGDGGQATLATLYNPRTVAVDSSRNIYIADSGNNRIRVITRSSGIIGTVAGTGPAGTGGDGGLATSAMLNYPYGVAVDALRNIYIADTLSHRIRMVTKSSGNISTVAGIGASGSLRDGELATSAALNYPCDVTVDSSGNMYIADTDNYRIRMVTKSTGIISTVAGTGSNDNSGDGGPATSATLYNSRGVTSDASGNIYIADAGNNRVRMFLFPEAVTLTLRPTDSPTKSPTATPTSSPTDSPTTCPSPSSSVSISTDITPSPTEESSSTPSSTVSPSLIPSQSPSLFPDLTDTSAPLPSQSFSLTPILTESPSVGVTASPTAEGATVAADTTAIEASITVTVFIQL